MSTKYRLVQSGKTASGGFSAGPSFVRAVAPRIIIIIIIIIINQILCDAFSAAKTRFLFIFYYKC
jgi:hypothetical protein